MHIFTLFLLGASRSRPPFQVLSPRVGIEWVTSRNAWFLFQLWNKGLLIPLHLGLNTPKTERFPVKTGQCSG